MLVWTNVIEWIKDSIELLFQPKGDLVFDIPWLIGHLKKCFLVDLFFFQDLYHVFLKSLDINIDFIEHQEMNSFFLKCLFPHINHDGFIFIFFTFYNRIVNLFKIGDLVDAKMSNLSQK
jgi:hypothetical protein